MRQDNSVAVVAPLLAPTPLAFVDGQAVNMPSMAHVVRDAVRRVQSGRGFTLFTLNLDHLVKRREHAGFRAAYARADFVTADGAPVVAMARRQGASLERTAGADLVLPLCEAAAAAKVPVYLFGATEHSLRTATARLKMAIPDLDVRGTESPENFDPQSDEALEAGARIAASGAKICFVAMGAPKQELFADRMAGLHDGVGYVCIGAALDFIAGEQQRAPVLFQRTGLEWAYRLLTHPRRLGLRYARCALLYARLRLTGLPPVLGVNARRPAPVQPADAPAACRPILEAA
jgi:exopolysaccharide biosynthesis WecB/TagA/CpsF family protein